MISVGSPIQVPAPYEAWFDAGGGLAVVCVRCPDRRVLRGRLTATGGEAVALRLIESGKRTVTIYTTELPWGDTFKISADLTQASATIYNVADDGEETATQYQTADARHDATEAVMLALSTCGRDYFAQPGDDRDDDEILAEIREQIEVESED